MIYGVAGSAMARLNALIGRLLRKLGIAFRVRKPDRAEMQVFDTIERTRVGPALNNISRFDWMNECAEPYAEAVRTQIEAMFAIYPADDQSSLAARIRSSDDSEHRSAILELILHEWMIRQGHRIVAIEPVLEHTSKQPDFLVEAKDGKRFFLEAVARQEEDDKLGGVRDALNAVDSPVYLHVSIKGTPTQTLSAKKIAKKAKAFIDTLDLSKPRENWPPLRWTEHGARFDLQPFSMKSDANRNARTIGSYSSGARLVSSTGDLERVLKTKAGRYGELPHPYVVATTTADFTTKEYELTAALYGPEAIVVDANDPLLGGEVIRESSGVWRGLKHKWTNTGLSAVVLIPDLNMTSLASRLPILMVHPEPRHACDPAWINADTVALNGNTLQKIKVGDTLGAQFGLPKNWPTE